MAVLGRAGLCRLRGKRSHSHPRHVDFIAVAGANAPPKRPEPAACGHSGTHSCAWSKGTKGANGRESRP
jgi:hypothetical protein